MVRRQPRSVTMPGAGIPESTPYRRALAGDAVGFEDLVRAHHHAMVRAAMVVSGDPDMANDAAQAAWSRAWRQLGSVRDERAIGSWLVAVACNEARQLVRRRSRLREIDLSGIGERPAPGRRSDPANVIDSADLAAALATLQPGERELVALRYGSDLSPGEIARLTGRSAVAVRVQLFRLVRRLRRELEHG
ncbi:MAG: RNA polymerase sigma factor [Chloroflexi bacterium]|nr:RNA polymerase sigma factor [Chloroflexota bacterium]